MRAVICTKYGAPSVLQLREVEKPAPKANEVRIQIHAAPVSMAFVMMRKGTPRYARLFLGLGRPKHPIPGTGFAGVVESVGSAVKGFKEGDAVFGETGTSFGTYAEYVCMPEDGVISEKPANLSFEEAACICDGPLTSLNFLREVGKIQRGERVLVNGASGSLGTAAVQLASYFGAEVTGVSSTPNLGLVRSLGAATTIDYTRNDFTGNGRTYDMVFDTVGKSSFARAKKVLSEDGRYLSPVLSMPLLLQMIWTSVLSGKKAKFSATGLRPASELLPLVNELKELFADGKLKIVIDRRYGLDEMAAAHAYVEAGHKRGNVVANVLAN